MSAPGRCERAARIISNQHLETIVAFDGSSNLDGGIGHG